MDFDEWVAYGRKQKWIGQDFCWVHDGPRLTVEEQEVESDEKLGIDCLCIHAVRLYEKKEDYDNAEG